MTVIGRHRDRADRARSSMFLPVTVFLAIWVVFGGNMPDNVPLFGVLALSGSALLALVVARGGLAAWSSLTWPARAMILFFCLMPFLQLIPLPPALWHALPGRGLAVETMTSVGAAQRWRPMTLSVEPTFRTLLVFLWLAAFFLALLQLTSSELRRVFGVVLMLGLLNVAVGVVQVVSGNTALKLYDGLNSPFLNGLFANKNHTGLFIALTYLAGYAALYGERGWNRRRLGLVVPLGLILFVALLATFSRAGVVFGMLAIAFLVLLSSNGHSRGRGLYLALGAVTAAAIVFVAIGSTDLVTRALARFGGVSDDPRWSIWQWSWPLVGTYFPVGAGIGSFTAIFPSSEHLAWVRPTYVNHAHNDYLEQLIEAGIAAPVMWLLTIAAIAAPIQAAWRERTRQRGRLALIGAAMIALVVLHSAVDYPLRRPAIAATFMVALASVLRMDEGKSRLRSGACYATHAA